MLKRLFYVILTVVVLFCLTACNTIGKDSSNKLSKTILSALEHGDINVQLEEKLTIDKKLDGKNGTSWSIQGGANDGTYGYFALNEHAKEGRPRTRIYKIDLNSWEIVKISGDLDLGHANDITYMPDAHQIIVTMCEAPGDGAFIVDADTLEIVDKITYPQQHPCMTYSPEHDRYVFSSWSKANCLTVYDGDLQKIMDIEDKFDFAEQCLACDEDLIYFLKSPNSGGAKGYIFVFNWEGEFIDPIIFEIPYEVENISLFKDKFILSVNDHHNEKKVRFYEMTLSVTK